MAPKLETSLGEESDDELRKILISLDALSKASQEEIAGAMPQTDDQLHQWIFSTLGVDIPRQAVCPHHQAPFAFLADLFFHRVDAALVMANRGGGKSYLAAIWNFSNLYWNPGIECLTVGAIEIQAKRVYTHIKQFQARAAKDKIESTTISETLWRDGQKMEIVTGSLSSVNGPHSQRVHRDEVELMDKNVYDESLQIERAKTIDNVEIKSQTLLTSTRKTSVGLMQQLLDECANAEAEGRTPPYKVYSFCIKECVQNVPNCRIAFPDLPEEEKCNCNEVRKGEWTEGKPRTFDQICNGIFSRSDGFIPLDDVQKTFMKSSKAMWDAQQECKRPYTEDVSIEAFSRENNCIYAFEPDPANGPIYQGIDFGGTNPHAVEWAQILDFEIEVTGYNGQLRRIPQDSMVIFAELYIAEIGNAKLADLVVEMERTFRQRYPKFRVAGRFADRQAKAARLDFKQHDPPLICSWPIVTRDRNEHFKHLNDRVNDNLFYVDIDECPMIVEEIEAWNIKNKDFDHAVDATLYVASNTTVLEKHRANEDGDLPSIADRNDYVPGTIQSPLSQKNFEKEEDWRKELWKDNLVF